MLIGTHGLGYGARTFTPIPHNPASQGSPYFYRSPLNVTQNLPGTGRTVYRAPWNTVFEPEPGAKPFMNRGKAFTPEGTLVPISEFPPGTFAFAGALGEDADSVLKSMKSLFMWGLFGGALVGLTAGAVLSRRPGVGRAVDAAVGSGLGAVAGAVGSVLVGRGASLAAKRVLAEM